MPPSPDIEDLLDRWEDLRASGQTVSAASLCRDCPELATELAHRIREIESMDALLDTKPQSGASTTSALDVPRSLGRYQLETLIGQGSFGQVWKGHDPELDRVVAVKVLRPELHYSQKQVTRFLDEAKKVAKLRHPNIVSVHDVGQDGRFCYIVSEFLDGNDMAHRFRGKRLDYPDAVRMVAKIALALQHAHDSGIYHRDVKPQNVLMDRGGEPFITDFGIAVTEAELQGGLSEIAGTPAYMSPEQALGTSGRIDGRTDLYSLGVMLYELLVGTLPYEANTLAVLRQSIRRTQVRPLREVAANIPPELDTVCMKALAVNPDDRWSSAAEFANELLAVLSPPPPVEDQSPPVTISTPKKSKTKSRVDKQRRQARRWRNAKLTVLAGLAVLVVLARMQSEPNPNSGEQPTPRANRQSDGRSTGQKESAEPKAPSYDPVGNNSQPNKAKPSLAEAKLAMETKKKGARSTALINDKKKASDRIPGSQGPDRRSTIPVNETTGQKLPLKGERWSTQVNETAISSCRFSPNMKYVLATSQIAPVVVLDNSTGNAVHRLDHNARAVWCNDATVTTLGRLGKIRTWDLTSGRLLREAPFAGCRAAGSFSSNGNVAIFTHQSQGAGIFDIKRKRAIWRHPGIGDTVYAVDLSVDGKLAAAGGKQGVPRLFSVNSAQPVKEFPKHGNYVQGVAISPDKQHLLTCSWDNNVRLFDIESGKIIRFHNTQSPNSAAFSSDGSRYAAGGTGRVIVWETRSGKELARFTGHGRKYVTDVSFSSDGHMLVSGGRDGRVIVWQID